MTLQSTPLNANSAALAASLVVKNQAGTLYAMTVTSTRGTAQMVQLHDSATLPADAVIPAISLYVAANAQLIVSFAAAPRYFVNGIVICNSSTIGTKTIGSADLLIDAQYN